MGLRQPAEETPLGKPGTGVDNLSYFFPFRAVHLSINAA
jgi:hypothetical protein